MPDFLAEFGGDPDMGPTAKDKADRDGRWVSEFTDELTVAIALRQWEQAVDLVEEGRLRRFISFLSFTSDGVDQAKGSYRRYQHWLPNLLH